MQGDKIIPIQTEDNTEAFGQLTLTMPRTIESIAALEEGPALIGKNEVRFFDNVTGFSKVLKRASVAEDVEVDLESEEFEVILQGEQLI
jgi:hypothetical protein